MVLRLFSMHQSVSFCEPAAAVRPKCVAAFGRFAKQEQNGSAGT